ncbi:hypothetical protein ACFCW4_38615, partial [Streptomyces virginiae]|uniref:hypothetical protein n=1 Tax=Streptomyces virginiae TaxID=1961 RepID=UPI0035D8F9D3
VRTSRVQKPSPFTAVAASVVLPARCRNAPARSSSAVPSGYGSRSAVNSASSVPLSFVPV